MDGSTSPLPVVSFKNVTQANGLELFPIVFRLRFCREYNNNRVLVVLRRMLSSLSC